MKIICAASSMRKSDLLPSESTQEKLICRERERTVLSHHVEALTQPHWAMQDLGARFLKSSSGLVISKGTGSQRRWNLVCKKNSLMSVVFRGTAVKHFVYMELNSYNLAAWGRNEASWGTDCWLFPSICPFPFKGPQLFSMVHGFSV